MTRLLLLIILLFAARSAAAEEIAVSSPTKILTVTLSITPDGRAQYRIERLGRPIIAPSTLGFLFTDQPQLLHNLGIVATRTRDHEKDWTTPWGEDRTIRDRYREMVVDLREKAGLKRAVTLEFRLYDDGVGFRYRLPGRADGSATNIAEELTQFRIPQDGAAWWAPAFESNREEYLYNQTRISSIGTGQTPLTMVLADGIHVSIHEAALVDYSGMNLARVEGTLLKAVLTPSSSWSESHSRGRVHDAVASFDDRG